MPENAKSKCCNVSYCSLPVSSAMRVINAGRRRRRRGDGVLGALSSSISTFNRKSSAGEPRLIGVLAVLRISIILTNIYVATAKAYNNGAETGRIAGLRWISRCRVLRTPLLCSQRQQQQEIGSNDEWAQQRQKIDSNYEQRLRETADILLQPSPRGNDIDEKITPRRWQAKIVPRLLPCRLPRVPWTSAEGVPSWPGQAAF